MIKAEYSEIPGTMLVDAVPQEYLTNRYPGVILGAESGGCCDILTGRWWVPVPGGHRDWSRNATWGTAPGPGAWEMIDPSTWPEGDLTNVSYYPDANGLPHPVSRHTYHGVHYLKRTGHPEIAGEALFVFSGARWPSGNADDKVWLFDLATRRWHEGAPGFHGISGWWAAKDEATNSVWGRDKSHVVVYDGDTNTWRRHSGAQQRIGGSGGANRAAFVIDERRRNIHVVYRGAPDTVHRFSMDPSAVKQPVTRVQLTGDTSCFSEYSSPGWEYAPNVDRLVVYTGGPSISLVAPETGAVERLGAGGIDPGPAATHGTYSRFRRVGEDEFQIVNRVEQNILKLRVWESVNPVQVVMPSGFTVGLYIDAEGVLL